MTKKYFFILSVFLFTTTAIVAIQPDTLKIAHSSLAPKFDGKADDSVWKKNQWISIDQLWIPWKGVLEKNDCSGRFKVLWSEKANLLYFVAEITDDVFRDGYIYSSTDTSYSEYDIFEIFLDPNRSGGLHVFDNGCDDANNPDCWGSNAESAFTYHINVNAPANGKFTTKKSVEDIYGTNWDDKKIVNFESHFPQFAFGKKGNTYTYEFSLKVYTDSYNSLKPSEKHRDKLFAGKIMGLAAAYCDDDHKTGAPMRDNFIGSTAGHDKALDTYGNFNQAWMNASYYGVAILVDEH